VSGNAELPTGWEWTTLGSIAEVRLGKMLSPAAYVDGLEQKPYLRNENVRWGRLDLSDVKTMGFKPAELERYAVEPGDLLICEGGEPGRSAVYWGAPGKFMYQKALHRVRPCGTEVSVSYLQALLQHYSSSGTGFPRASETTIQHLPLEKMLTLPVPLPPAAEQRRIVAAIEEQFTRLDAAVTSLQRARDNLKRYRVAVFASALSGALSNSAKGAVGPDISEPSPDISEPSPAKEIAAPSQISGIPSHWKSVAVHEVGRVQLGRQRSPKNRSNMFPTKYLRAANITWKGLDLTNVLEMEFRPHELEVFRLVPNDIVLSEASGSPTEAGKPAIWRGELADCCFQNTVIRFRPTTIDPRYALLVFRAYALNGTLASISHGVGIHHIGAERFADMRIPLPPWAEQVDIALEAERRLSALDGLEGALGANLKRAERLREAILKRAFEGKLVPQDRTDEPTAVLLDRIRADRKGSNRTIRQPSRSNAGLQRTMSAIQEPLPL
jgi:type I restriction enzyme S subunit